MDIPHRIGRADAEPAGRTLSSEDPAEEDEEQDDDDPPQTLTLEVYTAGEHAVSVLALVDRDLLPDPQPSEPPTIAVDVTDLVAEEHKQLRTDALRAVPGVLAGATTLSAASLDSAQHAAVLDVSAEASPLPHTYPTLGPGRPVSAAIAEQLLATAAV
ncbi:hypothetical protein [Nesterenkonia sp. NBAIMH1]|uniref:hypothetical protein n=1 Tax=Nesterenkonia sp. NBAIMH1 TaxID=2600320 RepID=UPI0011B73C80|nr:hypothetical protein [Nesterenkonia sp. NBAIMH1]